MGAAPALAATVTAIALNALINVFEHVVPVRNGGQKENDQLSERDKFHICNPEKITLQPSHFCLA
jgi:hypothetical protein